VRTRPLAMVGLVSLVPLALGLLRGTLTVEAAAGRAVVLVAVLALADRLVVPLFRAMLEPPHRRHDDVADADA
jgi:hypothetical protein